MKTAIDELNDYRSRIKNTSSTRFGASHRVYFNYTIAKLTVVVLSLWSIFISYLLTTDLENTLGYDKQIAEAVGVLLPVFVVVFSLIEGGENFLRANNLELNARQLRELADQLKAEMLKSPNLNNEATNLLGVYVGKYNDILERSPVNHKDIDHWSKHYVRLRQRPGVGWFSRHWFYLVAISAILWGRRQLQRALYIVLWVLPIYMFEAFHAAW